MIVTDGTKFKKSDYRSFKIGSVTDGTDDYQSMREALSRRLAHLDDENGSFSELPDLILMDFKMPLMDGLQATREIRKFNKDIVVIALTANAYDSDREHAYDAGCNDYMSKPVAPNELRSKLRSYFDAQEAL
jgi:CheY-like chemotaxis protein